MAKNKYIETPEKLLELFEAYSLEVKSNPKPKTVKGNKDFVVSDERLERPLTMVGFEAYVFKQGFNADLSHYFANYENRYDNYLAICLYIKKAISADQIEGGMCGIYQPQITQRLNGLTEKVETKNEHTGKDGGNIQVTLNII